MKKKFLVIPENIEYKINCLIRHIEKNEKIYYGIRTIYSVKKKKNENKTTEKKKKQFILIEHS